MKPFTTITIVLLALVAFAHLLWMLLGWQIIVDGTPVPMWSSVVGLAAAAGLAVLLWWENRK